MGISWTLSQGIPRSTAFVSYAQSSFPQSPNFEIPLKLAEAASGLQYLHSMDIIHSDLKPVRTISCFDRLSLT